MTPPEEPQAGCLGSILEEDIVIIGDDSFMSVIALEDLPVGWDGSDSDNLDPMLMYVFVS